MDIIEIAQWTTKEILDALTYYGYDETYRRLRGLRSRMPKRDHSLIRPEEKHDFEKYVERQRLSKLIHKLKKEGLVIKKQGKLQKAAQWILTKKGRRRKQELSRKLLEKSEYEIKDSHKIKIVIFDIPESERRKRAWLRSVLKRLKYKMLQRSVWVGRTVLPERFFQDLYARSILRYVEVFAVTKGGTLKKL